MKAPVGIVLRLSILLILPVTAQGQDPVQQPERQPIDGIAAIVGEEIILKSDVFMAFTLDLQQRGLNEEELSEEERQQLQDAVLDGMITRKVIVARARLDSIIVQRSEIETAIDAWIELVKENMGGEAAYQQQLMAEGITESELRQRRRVQAEEELLMNRMIGQLDIRDTAVSRRDGEEFLHEAAGELLVLRHIFLMSPENLDPASVARARIEGLRRRIIDGGEDFAAIARQYSDDTYSGTQGGDLGEATRGSFLSSIDDAIWSLPIGEVSEPVRSPNGWHLIQVTSRSGDTAQARHILVRVMEQGSAIMAMADTISQIESALRGGEDFEELVARYSDEENSVARRGYYTILPVAMTPQSSGLPYEWIQALQVLEPEDWTGPLESGSGVHFIQRMPLDDETVKLVMQYDFSTVELFIKQIRRNEETERWLQEIRAETYIEIIP